MNEQQIINKIKSNPAYAAASAGKPALIEQYVDLPIPAPYFADKDSIKAIVLGADPSNFSGPDKTTIALKTVFDLPTGDRRYFQSILNNLELVGLNLDNIYVQNIVRNYCTVETGDNKLWFDFAELWKPLLKEDLDKLDPDKKLPVFATAEIVLHSLLNDWHKQKIDAKKYFSDNIYHKPDENYLGRILFPCFRRHYPYSKYPDYVELVKSLL